MDYIGFQENGWFEGGDPLELGFWDAGTGEVARVALGPMDGCDSSLYVTNRGVSLDSSGDVFEYEHGIESDRVSYGIPWGDEAYPVVYMQPFRHDPDPAAGPDPYASYDFDILLADKLDVSLVWRDDIGLFVHLTTPDGQAYYDYDRSGKPVQIDPSPDVIDYADYVEHLKSYGEEMYEQYREFAVSMGLHGTDGYHYAVGFYPAESECFDDGFVVAGDTGEVVGCWDRYGLGPRPVFVLPEGGPVLDRFALPVFPDSGDCPQWSLSALRTQ